MMARNCLNLLKKHSRRLYLLVSSNHKKNGVSNLLNQSVKLLNTFMGDIFLDQSHI
jgi:hypothetical protein